MRGTATLWLAAALAQPICRNPLVSPFNAASVWNTPLGDAAVFSPAYVYPSSVPVIGVFVDEDYFLPTAQTDKLIPWISQGHWNVTPDCFQFPWAPVVGSIPWPTNVTITLPGNNALALLLPDEDSLIFTQPAYRCNDTAPLLSLLDTAHGTGSLRNGSGNWGGHGGSALNAIGGTLRLGELHPGRLPPTHTLKLQLWAKPYYYGAAFGATEKTCFHWPALQCDGYSQNASLYNGSNPLLTPGSLLAIPPENFPAVRAALRTAPAQALAWTLANYGGLLCDDTFCDRVTINAEHGFDADFSVAWGWPFVTWPGDTRPGAAVWLDDVMVLFRALHIVTSNSPQQPGGGGAPLQPPPPPFCN